MLRPLIPHGLPIRWSPPIPALGAPADIAQARDLTRRPRPPRPQPIPRRPRPDPAARPPRTPSAMLLLALGLDPAEAHEFDVR